MTPLTSATVAMVKEVIGRPDYSITLTLKPAYRSRRDTTKQSDAYQALSWFLHVLNNRCFGHGCRRRGNELGVFAVLEGIGPYEQPHWHIAVRLPKALNHERFMSAFDKARRKTRRFGDQYDIQPFYERGWFEYCLKQGVESFCPEFLRAGTP